MSAAPGGDGAFFRGARCGMGKISMGIGNPPIEATANGGGEIGVQGVWGKHLNDVATKACKFFLYPGASCSAPWCLVPEILRIGRLGGDGLYFFLSFDVFTRARAVSLPSGIGTTSANKSGV